MEYYDSSKAYYKDKYYKDSEKSVAKLDIITHSGFLSYPDEEYSIILETIRHLSCLFDSVYDMGCGCGLLLNYIGTHIGYPINLYGVDFIEESVALASSCFPNYHFYCKNVIDFRLPDDSADTSLIIIDPYHYRDVDLELLIQYYLQINAKILVYTYSDVISELFYKTIFDFELFKRHRASYSIIKEPVNTAILSL